MPPLVNERWQERPPTVRSTHASAPVAEPRTPPAPPAAWYATSIALVGVMVTVAPDASTDCTVRTNADVPRDEASWSCTGVPTGSASAVSLAQPAAGDGEPSSSSAV